VGEIHEGVRRASGIQRSEDWTAANLNVYRATGYGASLRNGGVTLDSLIKNGMHFAVCQLATRRNAGIIALQNGAKADEIYQEIVSNLYPMPTCSRRDRCRQSCTGAWLLGRFGHVRRGLGESAA
jgi:hypothetical protein